MIELDHVVPYSLFDRRRLVEWWPLRERSVRLVFVVVHGIGRENVLEVSATEDGIRSRHSPKAMLNVSSIYKYGSIAVA